MGMCVHLSPEGPTGNSPLGEAALNLLILQMFVGEPLSPGSGWALGVRVGGPVPALRVPRPAGETDRQTDGQSDVGSADLKVTTGSQGNRTQTEGSEDGYLSPFLEGQGQKRVD